MALRAVQFWKQNYHVDGFHILGEGAPLDLIMKDGLLAGTKIMAEGMDTAALYKNRRQESDALRNIIWDFCRICADS